MYVVEPLISDRESQVRASLAMLAKHWHIAQDSAIRLTRKRPLVEYALGLTAWAGFCSIFIGLGTLVWFHTGHTTPYIALVAFMVVFFLLPIAQTIRSDSRQFELAPDSLIISSTGVLGRLRTKLSANKLLFAYAEVRLATDEKSRYDIVIGYAGSDEHHRFDESDDADRKAIAALVRGYYRLPEFPLRAASAISFECQDCGYDLSGHQIGPDVHCPECGSPLRDWQIPDASA